MSGRTAVLFLEPAHSASGVDNLLLAGVKRVAGRADLYVQFTVQGRTGLETIAAGTDHLDGLVCRMGIGLHGWRLCVTDPALTRRGPEKGCGS